ncbi:hypothetical protein ACFLYX_03400 [Chloroflexota bacterium]
MEGIRRNYQTFIIVVLALNILATILLLFTPFGGMTVATAYGPRDRFASLGSEYSEVFDNLFIVLITICLIITATISFMVFKKRSDHKKIIKSALVISVITVLLSIIGGVLFNTVRAEIDYLDWWLDTGFYAGLIVGLVNGVFYTLALRKPE